MLDAPFSSLEADYATTLARRDRERSQPRRPRRDRPRARAGRDV
jgi:hypothetical protein